MIRSFLLAIGTLLLLPGLSVSAPFTIAEFNTWGVPLVVKDTYRYSFAMEELEKRRPDVIVLSEVFTPKGRRAFHSPEYLYRVDGPKAFPKLVSSGLRILSRHPILKAARQEFCSCKGDDCLSRKGALLALIQLPDGSRVNVLATHLNARGGDPIRLKQLEQILDLIRNTADPESPLILAGDLNFTPESAPYRWLLENLSLADVWSETHSPSEPGYTYDAFENPYARAYALQTHFPLTRERIDYLLYRAGTKTGIQSVESRLILNERPWYSDHYGVQAQFEIDREWRARRDSNTGPSH